MGRRHALGGIGIVADDALNVPILHLLRESPVGRLANGRRRQNGEPIGLVPHGAAAEVRELDHHRGAVVMAFLSELPQPGYDLVLVGQEIAKDRGRIARHDGRACCHGERDAALGLLDMIEPVTVLGHPVLGIVRLMRRRHDAVLEREMLQPVGLKQGIVGADQRRHGSAGKSENEGLGPGAGSRRRGRSLAAHHGDIGGNGHRAARAKTTPSSPGFVGCNRPARQCPRNGLASRRRRGGAL